MALVILVAVAGAGAPSAWSTTLNAPFTGAVYLASGGLCGGRCSEVGPQFNFTNGTGEILEAARANSSNLGRATGAKFDARAAGGGAGATVVIDFSFKDVHGTRALNRVNVTLGYTFRASYTVHPGQCPWVPTTHRTNDCEAYAGASAFLTAGYLVFTNQRTPPRLNGNCSSGCNVPPDALEFSIGGGSDGGNNSSGPNYATATNHSALATSGSVTFEFAFGSPVTHTRALQVNFRESIGADVAFVVRSGAGGLRGAYGSASALLLITSVTIVES